jgi:sortase A
MNPRKAASWLVSLAMIGTGLVLVALFFVGQPSLLGSSGAGEESGTGGTGPVISGSESGAEKQPADQLGEPEASPEDKTLKISIPKMGRIEDDTVPYAAGDDEAALRANAGIHLEGTGFPWEEEANVYIAGHRIGFPGTDSFLAFFDQQKLGKGDEIFVTDSEGKRYTYRVFEEFVAQPEDLHVTEPVEGKNILTLQTCTLPDYTERLVTRAELVDAA